MKKNSNTIKNGSSFCTALIYIGIIMLCIVSIYPMYYVAIMSISDPAETAAMSVYFYPKGFNIEAYQIIYVVFTTILMLMTCVMAAYPLTSPHLSGRKWVTTFLVIPMFFGGGLIPTYLLMTKLGLYNNFSALIIPAGFSIWNIILVKTYFQSIPESMREAASIDGANNYQIMLRLYLPLAKPILAVIAIYTVVGVWNSWFNAMVFLPNEKIQPLQLYLRRVLVEQNAGLISTLLSIDEAAAAAQRKLTNNQLKYAMIIFTTLPVIFVYPFFQKHFVKGVMLGSLKG